MKLNEITNYHKWDASTVLRWLEEHTAFGVHSVTGKPMLGSGSSGSRGVQIGSNIDLSNRNISKVPFNIHTASSGYDIGNNPISRLEDCGLPKNAISIRISDTGVTSLVGVSDIVERCGSANGSYQNQGVFNIVGCPIRKGGIGLILLKDLRRIEYSTDIGEPFFIISKYIGKPDLIYECQTELIEAGFEAYAEL